MLLQQYRFEETVAAVNQNVPANVFIIMGR